jgi:thymidylate synthase (FAD)
MRHRHTTPFEMVEFKFIVRVPMDCWRQWIRHRTASVNEYSTRYSLAIDSCQTTADWRHQAKDNKQGSKDVLWDWPQEELSLNDPLDCDPAAHRLPETYLSESEKKLHQLAREVYEDRITLRVAREQARKDLPLSTYTEAYWKIDLHNLLHFLSLRLDSHAQQEIRQYAEAIYDLIKPIVPITCEAFEDYRLKAVTFSREEMEIIKEGMSCCEDSGANILIKPKSLSDREWKEFKEKLK